MIKPFDLHGLKTYELAARPSKVFLCDLGKPLPANPTISSWLDSLPPQLGARDLKRVRDHLVNAKRAGRPVVAAIGGHVVKTGCGPYLIDWINTGLLHGIALNGAAAIHDFELAFAGKTSEDVNAQLPGGQFGMARETADAYAIASERGAVGDTGLGPALGQYLDEIACPHPEASVVLAAFRAGVPCTVHVSLGADIVHMHPHVSGAALGAASLLDFRRLCAVLNTMRHGVWLNIGSAVMLPEVLLKAVSVVRNFGNDLEGLVTVNLDMQRQYRSSMNVLRRPSAEGIELTGQHEVLIPLLHAAVAAELACVECVSKAA